eukprot:Tamp_21832.p2 GENE.Tamp_21832~~Tamp_21832.p2  ORF type:complete len:107 (-),score=17.64 Tamp_21832:578-898(-)
MQNAFMSRMENDIAKRDSDKRVNEMKKTAEGRRVLKQLGMLPPPSKPVSVGKLGGKKSPTAQATASAILGASAQVSAPKVVTHKGTKLNDAKPWNSETWARSTWLF